MPWGFERALEQNRMAVRLRACEVIRSPSPLSLQAFANTLSLSQLGNSERFLRTGLTGPWGAAATADVPTSHRDLNCEGYGRMS